MHGGAEWRSPVLSGSWVGERHFHGGEGHDLDHGRQEGERGQEEEEEEVLLTFPSGAALVCTPACWPGRRGEAVCTGTLSRSSQHKGDHVLPGCDLPSVSPHLPDQAWPYKWERPGGERGEKERDESMGEMIYLGGETPCNARNCH